MCACAFSAKTVKQPITVAIFVRCHWVFWKAHQNKALTIQTVVIHHTWIPLTHFFCLTRLMLLSSLFPMVYVSVNWYMPAPIYCFMTLSMSVWPSQKALNGVMKRNVTVEYYYCMLLHPSEGRKQAWTGESVDLSLWSLWVLPELEDIQNL